MDKEQCLKCIWANKLSGVVLCPWIRCVKDNGFKSDEKKVKQDGYDEAVPMWKTN